MDISSIASAALTAQRTQLANNLQMAILKSSVENESAAILKLLEGSAQVATSSPHLGNLIDTMA